MFPVGGNGVGDLQSLWPQILTPPSGWEGTMFLTWPALEVSWCFVPLRPSSIYDVHFHYNDDIKTLGSVTGQFFLHLGMIWV